MKKCCLFVVCLLLSLSCFHPVYASSHEKNKESKTAIVVAGFGTTVPEAVPAITNILTQVRAAYPQTEVRLCFTSNIIRNVWRKRQQNPEKWLRMGIPKEILYAKNIISVLGDLSEDGYRNIIVQPTHMFFMEQSYDLAAYVNAIASIQTKKERWKPFDNVVMGRPALGNPDSDYDYQQDVADAVKTLSADVALAKKEDATLVYMGHGNEHWATGIYDETAAAMAKEYPQVVTVIATVEGKVGVEQVVEQLKNRDAKKVVLKPFMIVAGDHARNDMAGAEEDSWQSILTANGFKVQSVLEGLGSSEPFAHIFVRHIADAAKKYNLKLN